MNEKCLPREGCGRSVVEEGSEGAGGDGNESCVSLGDKSTLGQPARGKGSTPG